MTDRFVRRLHQFARTVDYVDTDTLERIERTFHDYMNDALKVCYYEVCIDAPPFHPHTGAAQPNSQDNLQILWCAISNRKGRLIRLQDDSGELYSQKAYAFCRRSPLWLTPCKEDAYLRDCETKADILVRFSEADDVPRYRDYDTDGISKTAIVLPLIYEKQCIGVIDIEIPRVIPYGRDAREHVSILCEAVAIMVGRYRSTQESTRHTRDACTDLRQDLSFDECVFPGGKHQVFLSYPARADQAVIGELKRALAGARYRDAIEVKDWEAEAEPGPITAQIVDGIRTSRFGICYLSELDQASPRDGQRFRDNANVLFEAGMFHVLRHNRGDSLHGWLPIRESTEWTNEVPFNFAGDRILIVPRNDRGELVRELFLERLERHLDRLLES